MGATTALIGETLSDEYVEKRFSEGKGKYISLDKQVDLSTAYSPDTTWIIKKAHHNVFEPYRSVLTAFFNGTNETVDSINVGSQFMAYDFITRPVEKPTTETRLVSFMRFLTMIINLITKLFKGELDFSNLLA